MEKYNYLLQEMATEIMHGAYKKINGERFEGFITKKNPATSEKHKNSTREPLSCRPLCFFALFSKPIYLYI